VQHPLADLRFAVVDAGGTDADEHLAGPGIRAVDLDDLKDVDPTVLVKSDCLGHCESSSGF
jgi:hypothetical protein